jgi:hypothetical protein
MHGSVGFNRLTTQENQGDAAFASDISCIAEYQAIASKATPHFKIPGSHLQEEIERCGRWIASSFGGSLRPPNAKKVNIGFCPSPARFKEGKDSRSIPAVLD